jgi:hypothetical protein
MSPIRTATPGRHVALLADQADGLVFISEFTRGRFLRRFAHGPRFRRSSPISFDSADYIHPEVGSPRRAGTDLVVGNGYDHKDMSRTIELLTAAFHSFRSALGPAPSDPAGDRVPSGTLSGRAASFYGLPRGRLPLVHEGFGLPIVTTLAYGTLSPAARRC